MANLIDKKWKIVKPVRTPFKVIVPDDWKCVCEKGPYYKVHGCLCYADVEIFALTKKAMLPVYEHLVLLHNESLEGTIECSSCGVKYKPAVSHICALEAK